MKVVIIGAGNVATVLGRKIMAAGHEVLQVFARNIQDMQRLADTLHCEAVSRVEQLHAGANIYLLAITDRAIASVMAELPPLEGMVVHTAGSVGMDVLKINAKSYGILYPLQSLARGKEEYDDIPLLIDSNTQGGQEMLFQFALTLSAVVQQANDEMRLKLHLAAVVVNNFTNQLYALCADYCETENVPFRLLLPLIHETTERLNQFDPREVQTGPARRGDRQTIDRHLQLLKSHSELSEIYTVMTRSIIKSTKAG